MFDVTSRITYKNIATWCVCLFISHVRLSVCMCPKTHKHKQSDISILFFFGSRVYFDSVCVRACNSVAKVCRCRASPGLHPEYTPMRQASRTLLCYLALPLLSLSLCSLLSLSSLYLSLFLLLSVSLCMSFYFDSLTHVGDMRQQSGR